ncbi:MAG: hypothetical protein U0163_06120 [Gemmatimonadaceae bacterium]
MSPVRVGEHDRGVPLEAWQRGPLRMGEPSNAAAYVSGVRAINSRANWATGLATRSRARNGDSGGRAVENFTFHGHTSWQMSQP